MGGEGDKPGITFPPPPSVSWAQRNALVYIIFNAECEKPQIEITPSEIYFRGACGPKGEIRAVHIPLYATIDPEVSIIENKGRFIELVLAKERDDEPWWPALTSDRVKHHWLKVDFERWRDEDSDEEKLDDMDMFSNLGGDPVGDNDDSSTDKEEEEDLPDLE